MPLPATSDLGNATLYKDLVTANSQIKATVWSEKVLRTQKEKSIFRDFTGGERSGSPVTKKRDLEKGMAEEVIFTTVASVRGQGKLGENELKSATSKLNFGTFKVNIDLLRNAVSFSQVLKLLRFSGRSLDQLSSDLMGDWWLRKYDDDIQVTLRNRAKLVSPGDNLLRINNRVVEADLRSTDTLTTTAIESSKGSLISMGATEIGVDTDVSGAAIPKYLFFAPDGITRPLRSSATYLASLQQAEVRGRENPLFSGKYPLWDNNIIFAHNIKVDDADGRQGSPLFPMAFLGTAIADGTPVTMTGGGVTYAAGDSDYFAYFPGFAWKIYDSEVLPTDNNDYYAMIYNHKTDGKYEVVKYTAAGVHATGKQVTITRGSTTQTGGVNGGANVTAQAAGRFSLAHPSGAIIVPCTWDGVPLAWALHMGGDALFYATGEKDAERIHEEDDFKNAAGEAHLKAIGIQGVRGMSPFVDKR